jgi:hypothetical protein
MQSLKGLVYIALIIIGFVLSSCSKDSSNPIAPLINSKFTCTLNGGGYSNQTITLTNTGGAIYASDENETGIVFSSATNDVGGLVIKGKSTGTFTVDESNYQVTIAMNGKTPLAMTSGTIVVTGFGSVGGEVKGTFSGTSLNPSTLESVQVTNGSFSAKRIM